jgi:hypothetical protein
MSSAKKYALVDVINHRSNTASGLVPRSRSTTADRTISPRATLATVQLVPQLKFLASATIVATLEEGFLGIQSAGPGMNKSPREARGRLFSYDARYVLRGHETDIFMHFTSFGFLAPQKYDGQLLASNTQI